MQLESSAIEHALQVGMRSGPSAPQRLGGRILVKTATHSTNDDVVELALAGEPEGTVVFAESQSAGRGRKGNVWVAPAGENLLFSVLLRPQVPLAKWPRLAHVAGVAIVWGLQAWADAAELKLKWPNDVYADGKKLAGILVESRSLDGGSFAVIGAGININTLSEQFPPELRHQVTSLREVSADRTPLNRNALAGSVLSELNRAYELMQSDFDTIRQEMERCSLLLGKRIVYQRDGRSQEGTAIGFGVNGELKVRHAESGIEEMVLSADLVRLA